MLRHELSHSYGLKSLGSRLRDANEDVFATRAPARPWRPPVSVTVPKGFFAWLAQQRGYRSRINIADAEYFNAPDNLSRVATARRYKPCPTVKQVRAMLDALPAGDEIELRDRAVIAFALLSGARDRAIVSFKLKHIDVENELIEQDAREVRTKRAAVISTSADRSRVPSSSSRLHRRPRPRRAAPGTAERAARPERLP